MVCTFLALGVLLAFLLPSVAIPPTALRSQQAAIKFMWSIAASALIVLSLRAIVAAAPEYSSELPIEISGTHPSCAHDYHSYCQLWLC